MNIKLFILSAIISSLPHTTKNSAGSASTYYFQLMFANAPHNPAAYSPLTIDPSGDCPGSGFICFIEIPSSDVYLTGAFAGKPKVDINTPANNELYDVIDLAINTPGEGTNQNGRVIHETQLY